MNEPRFFLSVAATRALFNAWAAGTLAPAFFFGQAEIEDTDQWEASMRKGVVRAREMGLLIISEPHSTAREVVYVTPTEPPA